MNRSLQGVEVFSVGKWNGDEYSEDDLDAMVNAFKETSKTLRPPLKLGHDDRQSILQQDGLPAAGWIGNLYRQGKKLLADFVDIPSKVFDLLEKGAYKKVSAEIYWNVTLEETKYSRLLSAVALLGADMPAVSNLKDIMAMYKQLAIPEQIKSYELDDTSLIIKAYTNLHEGEKMPKTESEIKLELELEAAKKAQEDAQEQLKNYQKTTAESEKEIADLKKFKADAEKQAEETAKQLFESNLEKDVGSLVAEKLVSPSMKPYVKALLAEDKKEYSIQADEKSDEKKFSKLGLLKEILKLHKANSTVNFDENSVEDKVEGGEKEKVLNDKIEKYAKEHKVSYKVAYKAVLAGEKTA